MNEREMENLFIGPTYLAHTQNKNNLIFPGLYIKWK